MNGWQTWRLAALVSAACWCGLASAQEAGRPRAQGVLIDDLGDKGAIKPGAVEVPGALLLDEQALAEVRQAPPKSELAQFSDRLDGELKFVGRACALTPDERRSLDKVRDEILSQFKPLLERRPPDGQALAGVGVQRMAAVNGRVVVINAQGAAQFLIPDHVVRSQVDLAIHAALSNERLAALEAERKRLEKRTQQADLLALLAAIDEAMLLSDEQRERFLNYLDANWRPVWAQVSRSPLTPPGATPLQTAKTRGLGGIFDLFDADLEPILRPAQMAAWREMRTLRLDGSIVAQAGDRRAIAVRIFRIAPGAAIAQGGAPQAVVRVPVQRAQPAPGGRPLAEPELATSAQPPKELSLLLGVLVEDAALAAQLSDAQRETLLLAGQLDIRRYGAEREEQQREALERADEAPGNQRNRIQTETVATANPFVAANSRFRKALASRLSAEQTARLIEAEQKRRELRRKAAVQSLVREFDESAKLTATQWDALAEALRRRLPAASAEAAVTDRCEDVFACIAHVGKAELRPLVDDDQRAALEQKLDDLKLAAAQALQFRGRQQIMQQVQ